MNRLPHILDDDAVCVLCGFDGAEWWHLKQCHNPEGHPDLGPRAPECTAPLNDKRRAEAEAERDSREARAHY